MSKVKVTVSGTPFEFNREILHSRPFQKLPQIVNNAAKQGKPLEFSFDRPSGIFTHILSYYETGELHMPTCVCPDFFEKELRFWDIDTGEMSDCCYYTYTRFLNNFETQTKFQKERQDKNTAALPMVAVTSNGSFRQKVWRVVDSNTKPLVAKLYFILVSFMVLLSIGVLAFGTEPSMRRPVNKCELLEYLKYTKHPDTKFIRHALGYPACEGDVSSSDAEKIQFPTIDWESLWEEFENYMYSDYYGDDDDDDSDGSTTTTKPKPKPKSPNATTAAATSTTTATTTTTTSTPTGGGTSITAPDNDSALLDSLTETNVPKQKKVNIPKLTVPLYIFTVLERITMAFFTLDLFIRILSCPSLKKYFLSFLNLVDACALISSYVYMTVLIIRREYRYIDSWVKALEYLQIFRVLRLFRVVQNVRATQVLVYSIWQNLRDITLLGFLLFMAVSLFSTVLYFTEDRSVVKSIPQAWYWAVITLTTVGFGDITPQTYPGLFVSSACAVCGVLLLAVTLPIFVNNFLILYEFSCVEEANQNRMSNGSKTSGLVRYSSIDGNKPAPTEDKTAGNIFTVDPEPNKKRLESNTSEDQLITENI